MSTSRVWYARGNIGRAVYKPFVTAFASVLLCIFVLLITWTVNWGCVFKVWPEGNAHLADVLASDLASAETFAIRQGHSDKWVAAIANMPYRLVFEYTGVNEMGRRFAQRRSLSIPDTVMRRAYVSNQVAIETAMLTTQLTGVRLAVLLMMIPLLGLLYSIGAFDGITQRATRTANGARESASLYHRAKNLQFSAGALVIIGILTWPTAINWVLLSPALGLIAVIARTQWAFYKKHL